MSASLALLAELRARLVDTTPVTDLVIAANIIDRNARPSPVPSIILGEDQEIDEGDIARRNVRVYSTLHIWVREVGLTGSKRIAGAIRAAVHARPFPSGDGYHFADCRVSSVRFMRDPDGEHSHGVVTIETMVHEVRP